MTKHRIILIFSQMNHFIYILAPFFNYWGFWYLRLDGNTKDEERGKRMAKFNKNNSIYDLFLLSTRAEW